MKKDIINSSYFYMISILVCLNLITKTTLSQSKNNVYPVAYSLNGAITDSLITKEIARSIIGITSVYEDIKKVKSLPVYKYQLLTIEGEDSIKIDGNTGMLSASMKEQIQKLKSNDRLVFQGIVVRNSIGETRGLVYLEFRIK